MHTGRLSRSCPPAGFTHAEILEAIAEAFSDARHAGRTALRWKLRSENFQFELPEPFGFAIPTDQWPAYRAED